MSIPGIEKPSPSGDHFEYVLVMDHDRWTAPTRFDIKLYLVWITKSRKKLMRGDVGVWPCRIVRTIGAEPEGEILKGHVSGDHVRLGVSWPPHVSASDLMQRVKRPTGFQPVVVRNV